MVEGALHRATVAEQQVAVMEATVVAANRSTADAVQLQEASELECNLLRARVSELVRRLLLHVA